MARKAQFQPTFLNVLDNAEDGKRFTSAQGRTVAILRQGAHPVAWLAVEHNVRAMHYADTGVVIGAAPDWSKFLQWLMDNLPAILAMIAKIIAMFGG